LNTDLGLRRLIDRFLVYYRDRDSWGVSCVAELLAYLSCRSTTVLFLVRLQVTFSTVCIHHRCDQRKQQPVHVRRRRQTLGARSISCRQKMGEIPCSRHKQRQSLHDNNIYMTSSESCRYRATAFRSIQSRMLKNRSLNLLKTSRADTVATPRTSREVVRRTPKMYIPS
jgi:hypothetical protein